MGSTFIKSCEFFVRFFTQAFSSHLYFEPFHFRYNRWLSLVFDDRLPEYLSAELEQLHKHAMRIIYRFTPYRDALAGFNLEKISERRDAITVKLFDTISHDGDHKLQFYL